MTGPSKHYPDVQLKRLRDAVCRACPAHSPEVCLQNRRAGCYIDDGFEAIMARLEHDNRAVVCPAQTRLTVTSDPEIAGGRSAPNPAGGGLGTD